MRRASCIARDNLVSMGQCIGKFTHSGLFRLTLGALEIIAHNAPYKVWLKPAGEMNFLYGNHLTKSGLARLTENIPLNMGVAIYNLTNMPLGFGIMAKTLSDVKTSNPNTPVVFHVAYIGEYLLSEV